MTPVREAVRKACDAEAESGHSGCAFPECFCEFGERESILTALLAEARAEERERCVQAAEKMRDSALKAILKDPKSARPERQAQATAYRRVANRLRALPPEEPGA